MKINWAILACVVIATVPASAQQVGTSLVVGGWYNSSALTLQSGQSSGLQLDISGDLKTVSTVGGGVISATNGSFTNLLQGNAVLSPTNPIFSEVSDGTNTASVKAASTQSAATDKSLVVQLNPNQPANTTPLLVNPTTLYPSGSTAVTASATGTTAATTATIPAVASNYNFLCGFSIRANATAAITGNATVTGTVSGTLNFTQWTAPLASGLGVTEENLYPCVPSSATNTGIAVISAAPGSGGTVSVSAWGYYKTTTP